MAKTVLSILCITTIFVCYSSSLPTDFVIQTDKGLYHNISNYRIKRSPGTHFGPKFLYQARNGLHCHVCPPGFYKESDCNVNGTIAACKACPDGEFNSMYNIAIRCAGCSKHCIDENSVVDSECNATTDMKCRCKDGYYNHSKGSGEWVCLPHRKCSKGMKVEKPGTSENDTLCKLCPEGTFSSTQSMSSKCQPCSKCSHDQRLTDPCGGKHDATCSPKSRSRTAEIVIPAVLVPVVACGLTIFIVCLLIKRCQSQNSCDIEADGVLDSDICEETSNNNNTNISEKEQLLVQFTPKSVEYPSQDSDQWGPLFTQIETKIPLKDSKWKSFARSLLGRVYDTFDEADRKIEEICIDHQGVNEHIHRCLSTWKQKAADCACLDDILSALEATGLEGFAVDLKSKYSVLLLQECAIKECNYRHSSSQD